MGKSSKPNFQSPPSFQPDPFLTQTQQGLFDTGDALRQGRFLDPNDPVVGFLNDLVTLNPEATQQSIGLATRDVIRSRDLAQQDIINQLEANNQLTSSTTVNRLSDLNEQFSADIADIATSFRLADVERAFSNTTSLFGVGLDTLNQVGNRGLQNQQQTNNFALERFDREVALEAERFNRQLSNEAATNAAVGFFAGPVLGPAIGGIRNGGQGAQAGLQGGLQQTQLLASVFGTFSGLNGGAGVTAPTGNSQDLGLNQRLILRQQRALGGVA